MLEDDLESGAEGSIGPSMGSVSEDGFGKAKHKRASEVEKEMKLLEWHKLANEAALKAALIKERAFKEQEKSALAVERAKYANWIKQVELEERNKPLEVSEDFVREFQERRRNDEEKYKDDIGRRIKTLRHLQDTLRQQEDTQRRKHEYKLLQQNNFVSMSSESLGSESGPMEQLSGLSDEPTKVMNNLGKLKELEKRISSLEKYQPVPKKNSEKDATLTFVRKKTTSGLNQPSQTYYTVRIKGPPPGSDFSSENEPPPPPAESDVTSTGLRQLTQRLEEQSMGSRSARPQGSERLDTIPSPSRPNTSDVPAVTAPSSEFLVDHYKVHSERLRRERHERFRQLRDERTLARSHREVKEVEEKERQKRIDQHIDSWYNDRRNREVQHEMRNTIFMAKEKKRLFIKERKQQALRTEQLKRARLQKARLDSANVEMMFSRREPPPRRLSPLSKKKSAGPSAEAVQQKMVDEYRRARVDRIKKLNQPYTLPPPQTTGGRKTTAAGGKARRSKAKKNNANSLPR